MNFLKQLKDKNYKLQLEKLIIGVEEPIFIKGIGTITAKSDSGNGAYNVLHGEDFYYQGDVVVFTTFDDSGKPHKVSKKIQDTVTINIGAGHTEERPVVLMDVKFANDEYSNVPFTIGNRASNKNKVLLGRAFLTKELDALIDVARDNISGDNIQVSINEATDSDPKPETEKEDKKEEKEEEKKSSSEGSNEPKNVGDNRKLPNPKLANIHPNNMLRGRKKRGEKNPSGSTSTVGKTWQYTKGTGRGLWGALKFISTAGMTPTEAWNSVAGDFKAAKDIINDIQFSDKYLIFKQLNKVFMEGGKALEPFVENPKVIKILDWMGWDYKENKNSTGSEESSETDPSSDVDTKPTPTPTPVPAPKPESDRKYETDEEHDERERRAQAFGDSLWGESVNNSKGNADKNQKLFDKAKSEVGGQLLPVLYLVLYNGSTEAQAKEILEAKYSEFQGKFPDLANAMVASEEDNIIGISKNIAQEITDVLSEAKILSVVALCTGLKKDRTVKFLTNIMNAGSTDDDFLHEPVRPYAHNIAQGIDREIGPKELDGTFLSNKHFGFRKYCYDESIPKSEITQNTIKQWEEYSSNAGIANIKAAHEAFNEKGKKDDLDSEPLPIEETPSPEVEADTEPEEETETIESLSLKVAKFKNENRNITSVFHAMDAYGKIKDIDEDIHNYINDRKDELSSGDIKKLNSLRDDIIKIKTAIFGQAALIIASNNRKIIIGDLSADEYNLKQLRRLKSNLSTIESDIRAIKVCLDASKIKSKTTDTIEVQLDKIANDANEKLKKVLEQIDARKKSGLSPDEMDFNDIKEASKVIKKAKDFANKVASIKGKDISALRAGPNGANIKKLQQYKEQLLKLQKAINSYKNSGGLLLATSRNKEIFDGITARMEETLAFVANLEEKVSSDYNFYVRYSPGKIRAGYNDALNKVEFLNNLKKELIEARTDLKNKNNGLFRKKAERALVHIDYYMTLRALNTIIGKYKKGELLTKAEKNKLIDRIEAIYKKFIRIIDNYTEFQALPNSKVSKEIIEKMNSDKAKATRVVEGILAARENKRTKVKNKPKEKGSQDKAKPASEVKPKVKSEAKPKENPTDKDDNNRASDTASVKQPESVQEKDNVHDTSEKPAVEDNAEDKSDSTNNILQGDNDYEEKATGKKGDAGEEVKDSTDETDRIDTNIPSKLSTKDSKAKGRKKSEQITKKEEIKEVSDAAEKAGMSPEAAKETAEALNAFRNAKRESWEKRWGKSHDDEEIDMEDLPF